MEESPELSDVLTRPLYPAAQRRSVLKGVGERLGLSPMLDNFCRFLIDQRRTSDLAEIYQEYERLAEEAAGRLEDPGATLPRRSDRR